MQISSTGMSALTTSTSGQANARQLATDLAAQLVPSTPITATVKSVLNGQAVLDLGTTTLTLRTTDNSITPGMTVTVRFQENGKGVVDLGDGKTTTVMLETGEPPAATSTKSGTSLVRTIINPAIYTPTLLARNVPQFSQPIIRVEVIQTPETTSKSPLQSSASDSAATQSSVEAGTTATQIGAESKPTTPAGQTPTTTGSTSSTAQPAGTNPSPLPSTGTATQSTPTPQLFPTLQTGEVLVRSDGRTFAAKFPDGVPDTSGGPVFVRVTTTPRGLVLTPLAETPQLPTQVATALIRSAPNRPEIGTVVQNLLQSAANPGIAEAPSATATSSPALKHLADFLTTLLPQKGQPPDAGQIAEFVKHGGMMYESKIAEALGNKLTPREVEQIPAGDVKGQVMQALKEAGPVEQAKPLHDALSSIESQQALNVLASQTGEGIRLQLPLWDQNQWRTLDLTITPESPGSDTPDGQASPGYDIFMHTELTEFGDTYIDVQVHSGSFRSVLYIEQESARSAAKAALGELNQEVKSIGFQQVYVDVRSVSELPARTREQSNAFKGGVPMGVSMLDVRA